MFNLNPKEDKFYKMFSDASKNVYDAAILLRKSVDFLENKEIEVKDIERLEHKGDSMVHDIIQELNVCFITPIDREDIYAIAKNMDDILDLIDSTMHRFVMFNVDEATNESKVLCDLIVDATRELVDLMNELKLMNKSNNINQKIISINKIENEGDTFFRDTVAKLFRSETDTLTILKWKEIYQMLEDTIDSCERVANIVEGVVMKHA
ncbi:DUF47 domain-containing protein [Clostridium frigidicarnis]|uniref:Phosphate transport regulator n=1 Tax=Clostridium frigidicarnis TaxID=84698 RepID=A0A1I0WG81_9CLOT|nr:DUF47 family protein [Clostridium frigidicarnis]SFA87218.1 hypothetical protein SAMN04488528_100542 [Clostridium frigidicarnis]